MKKTVEILMLVFLVSACSSTVQIPNLTQVEIDSKKYAKIIAIEKKDESTFWEKTKGGRYTAPFNATVLGYIDEDFKYNTEEYAENKAWGGFGELLVRPSNNAVIFVHCYNSLMESKGYINNLKIAAGKIYGVECMTTSYSTQKTILNQEYKKASRNQVIIKEIGEL